MVIEYYYNYKGLDVNIVVASYIKDLYTNSCIWIIKHFYCRPQFYCRTLLFKLSQAIYKTLFMR